MCLQIPYDELQIIDFQILSYLIFSSIHRFSMTFKSGL